MNAEFQKIRTLEPKCYLSVMHARETDEMLQRMQYPQVSARKKCSTFLHLRFGINHSVSEVSFVC